MATQSSRIERRIRAKTGRRIRARHVVAGAASLVFLATPFTPLPEELADRVAVPARLEPAQAIVVLGGGLDGERSLSDSSLRRTFTGIRLYRQGLAPTLVFSGGVTGWSRAEGEVMAEVARELGVPATDVRAETASTNTWSEGVEVARLLRPHGVRRILLVTDAFHLRRAHSIFERAGFEVLPAPADPFVKTDRGPEARLRLMRRVIEELGARLYYRVRGWL